MVKKKIAKRVAFVAASAAIAGLAIAQPASAAQVNSYWRGTHAAIDNNPGSGAAGWVWVYGSNEYHSAGGVIKYILWDGTNGQLSANRDQTNSSNVGSDIREFRACTNWIGQPYSQTCGDWVVFG